MVWKEGNLSVAKTLNLELASQGKSQKEALRNLQEALDLLLKDEGVKLPSSSIPQNPKIGTATKEETPSGSTELTVEVLRAGRVFIN